MISTFAVIVITLSIVTPFAKSSTDSSSCEASFCKSSVRDVGVLDESLNSLDQADPRLVSVLAEHYLLPPSKAPYNFTNRNLNFNGQFGQPGVVAAMLKDVRRGFFVEAGAFDGEMISNTLLFEIKHQWTGLLIEPNPKAFESLKHKHRRAHLFGQCLSTSTHPEIVEFDAAGLLGGIVNANNSRWPGDVEHSIPEEFREKRDFKPNYEHREAIRIQCFPLYSLLLALGNPTVHFLSLDIEGAELQVLRTVPWDSVDVHVLAIEMNHVGEIFEGRARDIFKLMKKNGYHVFRDVAIDTIFVKNGIHYDNTV